MDCSGNQITKTITVDQSGKGDFTMIQDAIDSIKENNDQWVKVHIKAGTYKEKVEISLYKPCVFLEGEGKDVTTITYGDYDCVINATQGTSPIGFITAQARGSDNDPSGFVFRKGFVYGDGQVNLGRAYGAYSRVIYHGTYFSQVVFPQGWDPWKFSGRE
ncbi:unnamed protein product [Lupinus luteus]|uniref:Pectinesterase n=1 Tax=Lupinus luteus TaxID=3873 RepID=A0AAV1VRA9_LUPLU